MLLAKVTEIDCIFCILKNPCSGLPLCCIQHPDDSNFIADTPLSFDKRPEGGCDKMCDSRLPCGHSCPKFCHNYRLNSIIFPFSAFSFLI